MSMITEIPTVCIAVFDHGDVTIIVGVGSLDECKSAIREYAHKHDRECRKIAKTYRQGMRSSLSFLWSPTPGRFQIQRWPLGGRLTHTYDSGDLPYEVVTSFRGDGKEQ
jgi:hypothetical protein